MMSPGRVPPSFLGLYAVPAGGGLGIGLPLLEGGTFKEECELNLLKSQCQVSERMRNLEFAAGCWFAPGTRPELDATSWARIRNTKFILFHI